MYKDFYTDNHQRLQGVQPTSYLDPILHVLKDLKREIDKMVFWWSSFND